MASPTPYPPSVLISILTAEHPRPDRVRMLERELALQTELDSTWALRPLALAQHQGRAALILEDQHGEPLDRLLELPPVRRALGARPSAEPATELGLFLRLAVGLAAALGGVHRQGIIHKNIKPAHVLVNAATGQVWLTGFGTASRLARERQSPEPPEAIAGTLAYMAPEQTGRMNRSIDARSDLYALGVTLYEMLTGTLPFMAADPMEWVHCHIARQAMPPSERAKHVPPAVSAIIMKLLAKTAEERYQTAGGLERDLRCCLAQFETKGRVDDFVLGDRDTPDRLVIHEKLYGRTHEIEILLAAFDRIVKGGAPELVLVSGYSGIGKSAVVSELHKVLVPPRGLFAAGKFDQYKRDIPYSTLAQAFQGLVRSLLAKSDVELGNWRDAIRESLGPNGQLMVDLVPELKLIIAEQAPVPELPPQDAQRRFQLVFRRFLAVFARPEHPLALFLDDLQWLDAATLALLEDLLKQADVRHLLVIGAYRDNEVTSAHPLIRTLDAIKSVGVRMHEVDLVPLARDDVSQLIADSLYCGRDRAGPLAQLVHEKTGGNPFFVIQFLNVLADEGLLALDHKQARWSWNLGGIHAKLYTDNVVELLAGKLTRLPRDTQDALRQFACLGNVAEVATLSIILGTPEEQVHAVLWEGVRQQLVERLERSYQFVHDRVQEAAYALIPEKLRADGHLKIGRLLAAHTPPAKRDEAIFEIVNQLNRGALLITSPEERERLAELNLAAGKRAQASSAYASALRYLGTGAAMLPENAWECQQKLAFALELHSADCEVCTGALGAAEGRLAALAKRVADTVQRCAVARRRVDLCTMLGASDQAVAVGLECLRNVGIDLPVHPTKVQALAEYERIWSRLGRGAIEDLIELPLTQDAESLALLDVLTVMTIPAQYTDENLHALNVSKAVNLCLERGNSDAAPVSYAAMGLIAGARFGHHDEGYRLGKMACNLIERHGFKHFGGGRTFFNFAVLVPWTRPLAVAIDPARRAFQMGKDLGHPTFAALAGRTVVSILLALGHPLDQLEREAEEALDFVLPFGFFLDRISAPLALVRTLRGRTRKFGSLDDGSFNERSFEERLTGHPAYALLECYYWIRKLQARFLAGDFASAVDAADKAEKWYETSELVALFLTEMADFHFYAALSRAAWCEPMGPAPYAEQRGALHRHEQQLRAWAANCPQNFEDRAALVAGEIARLEGRELDAERLYERAIHSARENGFMHNEALANELAARFYAARGFETISQMYLRNARYGYLRWGADGKVRQLDQLYPYLRTEEAAPAPTGTIGALVEQLDLATVIKVSQTVSGEMVLEKLLDTVMRTAMEHAGAERAVLMLSHGGEQRIVAEATTSRDALVVQLRDEPVTAALLPETIVHYVLHTQESVILDDAAILNPFSTDPYIAERHARSVLCLPLTNQAKLIGLLYLENNLTPRVFVPARTAVLKVLASQVAISLENARLYQDVAEREARIRRLVDANIVGIFIWELDGRILEANDAFLTMLGYDRQDPAVRDLRWTDLTPPEWRERDERLMPELKASGTLQPFEKEYVRKDGSRVPVLVGVASFDESGNEGVAYVVDLTERKRAQEALNRAGAELAHVSRVTALSALTASIAHEVNQPLSGIITNAGTCLRMLDATPPNIDGARETARRTIRDGNRASEVIARLRALFSKREFTLESLDLSEAAREVIALSSSDLKRNHVVVQTELADDLQIVGDRIQLQQVVLNLLRNAADAMVDVDERQRQLLIKTEREDSGRVRLSVRDAGVGVSSQNLDSLFDPFYTTKSGGMGIGLFVSRSIIERHHGRLWAEPNQGSPGATFAFSIPIVQRS
jgi:PAS domain S-box-containing protein